LLRAPANLYDWHLGWLLGHRFVCVHHVGRRSGRAYRTVLEVVGRNRATDDIYVVSGLGPQADWLKNVRAAGRAEIDIGRVHRQVVPEILDEARAAQIIASYERRNRFVAPVVRRVLGWLVGWRYDGTESARRRLVAELPVVAFRRAAADSAG
jgi:deazaflavin-dependent oxidoreductase (nitroreductase family)